MRHFVIPKMMIAVVGSSQHHDCDDLRFLYSPIPGCKFSSSVLVEIAPNTLSKYSFIIASLIFCTQTKIQTPSEQHFIQ